MTPDESRRITTLANGEPLGEACPCHCHHSSDVAHLALHCPDCHGTGRIRTEPENDAERAVAKLRSEFQDAEADVQRLLSIVEEQEQCSHGVMRLSCPECITPGQIKADEDLRERIKGWAQEHRDEYPTKLVLVEQALDATRLENTRLASGMELAWGLIANASGGDWGKEPRDWKKAAERWRDQHWHPSTATTSPAALDAVRGLYEHVALHLPDGKTVCRWCRTSDCALATLEAAFPSLKEAAR